MLRALTARMRIDGLVRLMRQHWFDFWISQINPMSPYLHELIVKRADTTRPMPQRRTR